MERSYDNLSAKEVFQTLGACVKGFRLASVLTPVFMILEVIMEMIIPMLMASIIDEGVSVGNMNHIYTTGFKMIAAALFGLFAGVMGGRFGALASTGLARNLRRDMYANIQTFSFSNIDRFSSSGLVTRLTTDVTNVQNAYQMILRMFMRAPASLVSAVFMSLLISPKLASIYIVAVFFLGGFLVFVMRRVTGYFRQVFEKYDELNESVEENVSAIRVVKAFVRGGFENARFSKAAENIYRLFVRAETMLITNMPVMQFTVYACILSISYFGARLIVSDELSTGQLMSLLAYCMNILVSLMMLSIIFVMVSMSAASARRITEVLREKPDIAEPERPVTEVKDGAVEFRNVSFSYGGNSEKAVLKNIDISIRSGETVGIVGGTGSGKTSLVNLISRLYDVNSGELLVGGVNVREYSLETLRNSVAVVLQKNEIFSGSILENLRWGKEDATMEEVRSAAKAACADEFIERMEEGYDTWIEQGGSNISGGQKQRLCISRALLKSPRILILDDSTSAVDTATDAKIRAAFREYIPEVTKLIIAQRISSVKDADRILVLDQGRVSGFDTHEALMESNGIYRDVYESQNGNGDFDE
ncbi:MAG: ABC transporter ATP-binding protein/permease [Lachnospiraceae bacterium]|nr:ABC transporter ATP-binding protein/permease [Lachnospiraceae bacterium]